MALTAQFVHMREYPLAWWSNDAALAALPWWRPDERVVTDGQIGALHADGRVEIGGDRTAADAVWRHLVSVLPVLPWSEIRLIRADWEWPRAVSVPGAVLVASAVDVTTHSWALLYLIHEALHQWIGGVVACPTDHAEAAWMEAWVDAATWRAVEEVHPSAGAAFQSLFARYETSDERREHALRVAEVRAQLLSTSDLSTRLAPFVGGVTRGTRAVFRLADWNTRRA